jgi:hypothetical protein
MWNSGVCYIITTDLICFLWLEELPIYLLLQVQIKDHHTIQVCSQNVINSCLEWIIIFKPVYTCFFNKLIINQKWIILLNTWHHVINHVTSYWFNKRVTYCFDWLSAVGIFQYILNYTSTNFLQVLSIMQNVSKVC